MGQIDLEPDYRKPVLCIWEKRLFQISFFFYSPYPLIMKLSLLLPVLLSASVLKAQSISLHVDTIKLYSQNNKFYMISIPYDNEFPSLRGKTLIYENGHNNPMYVLERGFDLVDGNGNNLTLSNSGELIFYVIPRDANENEDGLKSITIYKSGKIFRSFTLSDITGCDKSTERCSLVYSNLEEVVDRERSNWGTINYKRVFKDGIDEKEKFLCDYPLFGFDDTIYLVDSKKKAHLFDLKEGNYLGSESFEQLFERIKNKGRFNHIELTDHKAPIFLQFPNLMDGKNPYEGLADYIGMKTASNFNPQDEQYRIYSFKMSCNISRDGSLEMETLDLLDDLPKDKIKEFFTKNRFDVSSIPKVFDKWYLRDEIFSFRKLNDKIARQEKQLQMREARRELKKRQKLEVINNVYIPKNLGECFGELDKLLKESEKREMQAFPEREDIALHHFSLRMRIGNDWGLKAGSRLQKYFTDKGISTPDEMTFIILNYYCDWLNGKKEVWRDWEKHPTQKMQ